MPEGPELAIAAAYIERVCRDKLFSRIVKSTVTKCTDVAWNDGDQFTLTAASRGKELMVCIESVSDSSGACSTTNSPKKYVLFHFGMSGRFAFTDAKSAPKHAHLSFVTADHSEALHFVDTRRFGKWEVKQSPNDWSTERGPCALTEYQLFRESIAKSINDSVFDRPLCEAMLDQRYFNGIGNYLRAEIIYRAGVPPFEKARTILQPIFQKAEAAEMRQNPDLLGLCRIVQEEVVALQGTHYTSPDHYLSDNDKAFDEWLQCYGKRTMNQLRDANKRMMWFSGPAGSMAKRAKQRADGVVKRKKRRMEVEKDVVDIKVVEEEQVMVSPKKRTKVIRATKRAKTSKEGVAEIAAVKGVTSAETEINSNIITANSAAGIMTRSRAKILKST